MAWNGLKVLKTIGSIVFGQKVSEVTPRLKDKMSFYIFSPNITLNFGCTILQPGKVMTEVTKAKRFPVRGRPGLKRGISGLRPPPKNSK